MALNLSDLNPMRLLGTTKSILRRARCYTLFALLVLLSSELRIAPAHETWLLPNKFRCTSGEQLKISLTSGMEFPHNETGIKPERIKLSQVRLGNEIRRELPTQFFNDRLELSLTAARSGVATVSVELVPKGIELTDQVVEEYFEEINASEKIREQWNRLKGKKPFQEQYTKHAKTVVSVSDSKEGSTSTNAATEMDQSWKDPLGLTFELVPLTNPTQAKSGQLFEVQALKNGKPFESLTIGWMQAGSTHRHFATTNSSGIAKLKFEGKGPVVLYSVDLRLKSDDTWESDFTTLTLEVQ